jgi:PAS domain S-box-containing protein
MEGVELTLDEHEVIVSHTDVKGKILYANSVFCKYAGYEMEELMGKPHNIIRHPDMPKAVFKLLWMRVLNGESIYAFVKNRKKNGDYYWVKGFTTPIMKNGQVSHILSYRKRITEFQKETMEGLYKVLVDYEKSHSVDESLQFLVDYLAERNMTYDEMVDRLSLDKQVTNKESLNIDTKGYLFDHIIFREHITHHVDQGHTDVEVTKPCCCRFGKFVEASSGKDFTKHPEWRNVDRYHKEVHGKLQEYVDVAKKSSDTGRLNAINREIKDDTEKMFSSLEQLIREDTKKIFGSLDKVINEYV